MMTDEPIPTHEPIPPAEPDQPNGKRLTWRLANGLLDALGGTAGLIKKYGVQTVLCAAAISGGGFIVVKYTNTLAAESKTRRDNDEAAAKQARDEYAEDRKANRTEQAERLRLYRETVGTVKESNESNRKAIERMASAIVSQDQRDDLVAKTLKQNTEEVKKFHEVASEASKRANELLDEIRADQRSALANHGKMLVNQGKIIDSAAEGLRAVQKLYECMPRPAPAVPAKAEPRPAPHKGA